MAINYLKQEQTIAKIDRDGNIIGGIEKWEAHKKGALHKGFSVILKYKNYYFLQHRKHPLFDGMYDLTISTLPIIFPFLSTFAIICFC